MPVLRGRVLGVGSQDCGGTTEPPNGVLGGPRLPRPSTPISLTVPQDIPFGLSPHSLSGPPGKLGPFPPTPISPASLHPDTDVPSGELPWHPWGLSSLLLTLWTPQCMGTAAGWGWAAAGSPPGTGISPEAPRGVRSFSHQLWLPFSLLLWHIWSVPSCWARCSHASLDLLQEWESRREKGGSAAERPIPAPSPRLLSHEAPR